MRRIALLSAAVLGLAPVSAFAGSFAPPPAPAVSNPIILVDGWWEREHRYDEARDRYWRLPPPQIVRYNRLQAEINQLVAQRAEINRRIARAQHEQHEILGFDRR